MALSEQEKVKREIKFIELAVYLAYRRFKITNNGTTK